MSVRLLLVYSGAIRPILSRPVTSLSLDSNRDRYEYYGSKVIQNFFLSSTCRHEKRRVDLPRQVVIAMRLLCFRRLLYVTTEAKVRHKRYKAVRCAGFVSGTVLHWVFMQCWIIDFCTAGCGFVQSSEGRTWERIQCSFAAVSWAATVVISITSHLYTLLPYQPQFEHFQFTTHTHVALEWSISLTISFPNGLNISGIWPYRSRYIPIPPSDDFQCQCQHKLNDIQCKGPGWYSSTTNENPQSYPQWRCCSQERNSWLENIEELEILDTERVDLYVSVYKIFMCMLTDS